MANHVLGSVLCCPGCFSVYRAKALKDVLSEYSTTADHAVDFLTKDMGKSIEIVGFKLYSRRNLVRAYFKRYKHPLLLPS